MSKSKRQFKISYYVAGNHFLVKNESEIKNIKDEQKLSTRN